MKIVLDTNVWISAFLFKGVPLKVISFSVSHYKIYRSSFLENELEDKLSNKFLLESKMLAELMDRFKNLTYDVECTTALPSACRNIDDNYILQLCESSGASLLVTGDKDLLVLKTFQNTQIISPSQFAELFINNQ